MKKIIFTVLLLQIAFYASAQSHLSASAKSVLHTIEQAQRNTISQKGKLEITGEARQELSTHNKNNVSYIAALLKVDHTTIDTRALNNLGVIINTKAGDIWTAQIPVKSFSKISNVTGIKAIDTGGKMKLLMDEVRTETKANEVYQGINLSQAYFGDNVVVGIIDAGFDYTHPNFYDPVTKQCRISRVWNQNYKEEEAGLGLSPPAGYNYGMELVNPGEMIKNIDTSEYKSQTKKFYLFDGQNETHGTHTAGTATGSGWETNGKYQGIAPKAEIVMVSFGGGQEFPTSRVIDAMQYIYNYAASVHKPAVIKFRAGTYIGPHDGTSLFCQGINNLTGEGKIMVGCAGNDGGGKIHLSHSLNTQDTVVSLLGFKTKEGKIRTIKNDDMIDCWASPGTDFSVKVLVYKNGIKIGETKFIAASSNNSTINIINDGINTASIKITTEAANPNNNRPNVQINIIPPSDDNQLSFELVFAASNTILHAWGLNGFLSTGQPRYIGGDDLYSIMDGQTAENIITVGAYAARNKYTNIYNEVRSLENDVAVGNITNFSSMGPTLDGRTKPDITAPGLQVISSISSFMQDYGDEETIKSVAYTLNSPVNGRIYKYAADSGTSMASPVVAGAVALMLEANPKLNPQQVLTILKNTARTDHFTGNIPSTGSNTWGWGKIDIHAAVKAAEIPNLPSANRTNALHTQSVYPNPATDMITITLPEKLIDKPCSYTILDLSGKQVATSNIASSRTFTVPVTQLPRGIYLLKITGNATTITKKFIKQ